MLLFRLSQRGNLSKLETKLSKIISHLYIDSVVLTITNKRYYQTWKNGL